MISLTINGQLRQTDADPATPLLWVLRDGFRLNGTKFSCGMGLCGACTVLLDGKPLRSCVLPVSAVGKQEVTTIEGLPKGNRLHKVQQAWIDVDVPQCGYCQSGQILSAVALLQQHKQPTDEEIDRSMNNLCRCGTYPEIREAIHVAARKLSTGGSHED